MTIFSMRALAAALMMGTSLAAAPALAKDKPQAAPAGPVLTEAVRTALLAADTARQAGDLATAQARLDQAVAAVKTDDDRYWVARTRLNILGDRQKANAASVTPAETIPALTALIDSPKLSPTELPNLLVTRAGEEQKVGQYAQSSADLSRARQLGAGAGSTDLPVQLVESKVKSGDVAGGLADLKATVEAEVAAGRKPPLAWYDFGIFHAQQANLRLQMVDWLGMRANAYPTPSHWHDAIVLVGLDKVANTPLEKQRAVDLYRLLHQARAIADAVDYRTYVYTALEAGQPYEAKTILSEASSLGKLPTTKIENASTMKRANLAIAALGTTAALEAKANGASSGAAALAAGDADLGSGNYARAATMYRLALQKGGADADLANLRLGEALALSGDRAGATEALTAVGTGSQQADVALIWKSWINRTQA